MRKLFYVSNNCINCNEIENPFFSQEKEWMIDRFGTFHIVCDSGLYTCDANGKISALHRTKLSDKLIAAVSALFDNNVYHELVTMIKCREATLKNILKLYLFSLRGNVIYKHLCRAIKDPKDTVMYSFWLSYDAYAAALIKTKHPKASFISRAHAYEIDVARNTCNPYLMKQYITKYTDRIAFISQDSFNKFNTYCKTDDALQSVIYLGSTSRGAGYVARKKHETLTILTCSSIVEIKRLDRLIDALSDWCECPVHWIHIGDGPLRSNIEGYAADRLKEKIEYTFLGALSNAEVHEHLRDETIDVFVNVSDSEGVPVSIMEAMSASIPVVAPRMNGIPELVTTECGILYEPTEDCSNLLEGLKVFYSLSEESVLEMGKSAYARWNEYFCLEKNLGELMPE